MSWGLTVIAADQRPSILARASVLLRSTLRIPGARLRVLANTGHFVPEEQPARVAEEVTRFLASIG